MAKIKTRVYVVVCISCSSKNATFCKIADNVYLCSPCKDIFEKKGTIKTYNGGMLNQRADGNIGYVPPEPKKEEIVEEVEQK